MAFVFKSPRNLSTENEPTYPKEPTINQCEKQNILPSPTLKKSIKGPAFNKNKTPNTLETQFYIVKDAQQMQQIRNQKLNNSNKSPPKEISKQQYFFKSKIARNSHPQMKYKDQLDCPGKNMDKKNIKLLDKKKKKMRKVSQSFTDNKIFSTQKLSDNKDKNSTIQNQLNPIKQSIEAMGKRIELVDTNSSLLNSKKAAEQVFAIPSIPGKNEKFGYVVSQTNLSYPKLVPKPRYDGEKGDLPGPTDYSYSLNKKVKGVLSFKNDINAILKNKEEKDFYGLINDNAALQKHNEKIKEWVKEGKKRKLKKQSKQTILKAKDKQRDLSTASHDQQSGESIYQDDTTPGPGYYNYTENEKKDFRSKNETLRKIFYSQSKRFKDTDQKNQEKIHIIFVNQKFQENSSPNSQRNNKFFISKLKREIRMQNTSISPPPGYYDVRISMQNDIIAKILRNSPNLFNNKLPRLMNSISTITPGPGSYSTDEPKFKIQSFASNIPKRQPMKQIKKIDTSLNECQQSLIQSPKQRIKRIHERDDDPITQNPIFAPFMSTLPRGLELKSSNKSQIHQISYLKPNESKIKENIYPFNSSEIRNKEILPNYVAEAGLYDLKKLNEWEIKSFNVLFN